MIPKVIHYCWFGRNPKSELIQKCIDSWHVYCPDYEIIEWNEDNFDVNCIPYTAAAYADKKWAFVSDYARLKVVHDNGGIYLDTDVLLHSSIDFLLQYSCWVAQEDIRYISTGLGFGAEASHPFIQHLMKSYESNSFQGIVNSELDSTAAAKYLTQWAKSPHSQTVNDIYIVGMKDYGNFAHHLATYSWKDEMFQQKRYKELMADMDNSSSVLLRYRIKCMLRNPKLISFLDNKKGTKTEKIITFCIYDLLDYGPLYFIKRKLHIK